MRTGMAHTSSQRQSGAFSDFVSSHPERILESLVQELFGHAPKHEDLAHARQFYNAMLIALTAEDVNPLAGMFELGPSLEQPNERMESIFRHFEAFATAAHHVIQDELAGQKNLNPLLVALTDDMLTVQRGLLLPYIGTLNSRIAKMQLAAQASGSSLSITLHELRRPLTILSSYSQLLSTGMLGNLPEPVMTAIEGITSSTDMMIQLVNTLAEISRLEDPDDEFQLEPHRLDEIVGHAIENIEVEAKLRETAITTAYHDPAATLHVDRRRFVMALTNILSNALKHTPPGTSIDITSSRDAQGIHITVRDHGSGFPPEDAEHLFEKYFRSSHAQKRKVPGTGLGLFIVKTVIERHKGTVLARTVLDAGAEFEIIMPEKEG